MSGLFDLFATILAGIYGVLHSYGWSVVLLTLLVMLVTTPLTYKGTKSMLQMQRMQPQLKAIQNKYRGDREKMNEELLKFYKANNINPVGGCLPLLIQAPVFLILFRVIRGLTKRVTNYGLQVGLTAINVASNQPLAQAKNPTRDFDPGYISHKTSLYQDLSVTSKMKSFGIDMSESAKHAVTTSITHALPYLFLIVIVLISGIVQQRQIAGRNTGAQVNAQQQMIMKLMPIFLPVFSFAMPAALVVYFVVSNLWRIGQQAVITRRLYTGEHSLGRQAMAARTVTIDDDEEEPAPKPKVVRSEAPAPPAVGRNRSPMARPSGRVGRRLAELENRSSNGAAKKNNGRAASGRKSDAKADDDKKGDAKGSPKYASGRVTPKRDEGKNDGKKRK